MARCNNGSAIWLVMACMTALISLCSVMSYQLARSAEIARLIIKREEQYEIAEEMMNQAIRARINDADPTASELLNINAHLKDEERIVITLSCDLQQTDSIWSIKHWRQVH